MRVLKVGEMAGVGQFGLRAGAAQAELHVSVICDKNSTFDAEDSQYSDRRVYHPDVQARVNSDERHQATSAHKHQNGYMHS